MVHGGFPHILTYVNVGQNIAAALTGSTTVADALEKSQELTTSIMTKAGYIK